MKPLRPCSVDVATMVYLHLSEVHVGVALYDHSCSNGKCPEVTSEFDLMLKSHDFIILPSRIAWAIAYLYVANGNDQESSFVGPNHINLATSSG